MLTIALLLGLIAAIIVGKYSFGESDTDEEFNKIFEPLNAYANEKL